MFTGLIEAVCKVNSVVNQQNALKLAVDLADIAADAKIGDSIAVNGTCLTVTKINGHVAEFDVSPETLTKSAIGRLKTGSAVNIERALKPTDRFGGHFVQGHVDGIAKLKSAENKGKFWDMKFSTIPELLDQIIPKGSVAIDGISLTIADIDDTGFSVAIIPQTMNKTNLSNLKTGDSVNIETDIIVKTVKKQLENLIPKKDSLTVEKLKEMGF